MAVQRARERDYVSPDENLAGQVKSSQQADRTKGWREKSMKTRRRRLGLVKTENCSAQKEPETLRSVPGLLNARKDRKGHRSCKESRHRRDLSSEIPTTSRLRKRKTDLLASGKHAEESSQKLKVIVPASHICKLTLHNTLARIIYHDIFTRTTARTSHPDA